MIGRVKSLFGIAVRIESGPQELPQDELRLAAACILVEAALVDGHVDVRETQRLIVVLGEHFGLDGESARELVARASVIAGDAVDWNRFTRVLKSEFGADERMAMMEMLWQVVLADGELHAYEDSLVRRIAGLLHVSDHDRARAKRRVEGRLGSARDAR